MKLELQVLKAKIRGFELEAQSHRKYINSVHGDRRCMAWQRKREFGTFTREHLLAYGLLRNIPYEILEHKTGEFNAPNTVRVLEIIQAHVPRWERDKWTKERVAALLTRPVAVEVAVAS